jgi:hypothetical protein
MSDRPDDAVPTQPQPNKPVSVEAATPFKQMPRPGSRGRSWQRISVPLPLQFAMAVIVGVLIATGIAATYVKWSARVTAEANARATQEEIERIARERQQEMEAQQRAASERQQLAEQEARLRAEKLREEQRLAEESRRSAMTDAQRMEQAFAASYRKPPGCADAATLECANHYIRAKRAFEAQYLREQARQRAASSP